MVTFVTAVRHDYSPPFVGLGEQFAGPAIIFSQLCCQDGYVASVQMAGRFAVSGMDRTPHNQLGYSVRRNSISPLFFLHGAIFFFP
jgi:hypothetical protein